VKKSASVFWRFLSEYARHVAIGHA